MERISSRGGIGAGSRRGASRGAAASRGGASSPGGAYGRDASPPRGYTRESTASSTHVEIRAPKPAAGSKLTVQEKDVTPLEQEAKVLSYIQKREAFIEEAKAVAADFKNILTRGRASLYRELGLALESLRRLGVDVVENIVEWRRVKGCDATGEYKSNEDSDSGVGPPKTLDFLWNGQDYLVKMYRDMGWLDKCREASRWLSFRAEHNPFVIPPYGHAGVPDKEYVPKMSKRMRQRAAHGLTLIKRAFERASQRAILGGSDTRFTRYVAKEKSDKNAFNMKMIGQYDRLTKQFVDAQGKVEALEGEAAVRVLQKATRNYFNKKIADFEAGETKRIAAIKLRAVVVMQTGFRIRRDRREVMKRRGIRPKQHTSPESIPRPNSYYLY